jgi:hypothetical protein
LHSLFVPTKKNDDCWFPEFTAGDEELHNWSRLRQRYVTVGAKRRAVDFVVEDGSASARWIVVPLTRFGWTTDRILIPSRRRRSRPSLLSRTAPRKVPLNNTCNGVVPKRHWTKTPNAGAGDPHTIVVGRMMANPVGVGVLTVPPFLRVENLTTVRGYSFRLPFF